MSNIEPRFLRNFTDKKAEEFIKFSQDVVNSLTDNEPYLGLQSYLPPVQEAIDNYRKSIPEQQNISSATRKNEREMRKALNLLMRNLADGAQFFSKSILSIMETSALDIGKTSRTPLAKPDKPTNVEFVPTAVNGAIEVTVKKAKRGKTYFARLSVDGEVWPYSNSSPNTTIPLANLPTNTRLMLQVQAINSGGYSDFTAPIYIMIPESNGILPPTIDE